MAHAAVVKKIVRAALRLQVDLYYSMLSLVCAVFVIPVFCTAAAFSTNAEKYLVCCRIDLSQRP